MDGYGEVGVAKVALGLAGRRGFDVVEGFGTVGGGLVELKFRGDGTAGNVSWVVGGKGLGYGSGGGSGCGLGCS